MHSLTTRQKLDLLVGFFIIGAALSVVFIALRAANIASVSAADGYVIRVQFDQIGGLKTRAPVKSSGVLVGRVKTIDFNAESFIAEVLVIVEGKYQFPDDSIFSIVSGNLLGGQYISISPGGSEDNLPPNAVISGDSAIVLEELISKFLFDKADE
ncbi:MAG: outer membrane lipid asymmetry maintenance protein MlaD [Betaproteobacteria bacterium]|nr:outer membrane lipid asymmetry maintenance protein MlaD [Betaproteobacteria bacterium]